MPERSLSQVLIEIQGGDKLAALEAAGHARRRQELLEEVRQLIAEGHKMPDPIAAYTLLFASSRGPKQQAEIAEQLRKIDAGLKAHSGEPVLLVKHHRSPIRESGCFHGAMYSDRPELHLGFLGTDGLVFGLADPGDIALSTTKYVSGGSQPSKANDGLMPIPAGMLGALLGLGLADVDLVVGYEGVMQVNYRLMLEGGSDKLAELMQTLGLSLSQDDPVQTC